MKKIIIICVLYLLVGCIEGKAQTYQQYFEYSYPYEVRMSCRDVGNRHGFYYSIVCANDLIQQQKDEEMRQATLDLIRSTTELNKEITDRRKYRRRHND